jgi:hypothetical protein
MKLKCLLLRRELERAALAPDSEDCTPTVAQHLVKCADCRGYVHDVRRMGGEISAAFQVPEAGSSFLPIVWQRIDRAQPSSPSLWSPTALAVAAAVALTAFVVGTKLLAPATEPSQVVSAPDRHQSNQRVASNQSGGDGVTASGQTDRQSPKVRAGERRPKAARRKATAAISHAQVRRHRKRARREAAPRIQTTGIKRQMVRNGDARQKQTAARPKWVSWGAWFETRGDYLHAATAYGQAYQEQKDPTLAFAAGRSAECGGDIAQAVDYYAQLLSRKPEAGKQPEKGSYRWSQDHDSV